MVVHQPDPLENLEQKEVLMVVHQPDPLEN